MVPQKNTADDLLRDRTDYSPMLRRAVELEGAETSLSSKMATAAAAAALHPSEEGDPITDADARQTLERDGFDPDHVRHEHERGGARVFTPYVTMLSRIIAYDHPLTALPRSLQQHVLLLRYGQSSDVQVAVLTRCCRRCDCGVGRGVR